MGEGDCSASCVTHLGGGRWANLLRAPGHGTLFLRIHYIVAGKYRSDQREITSPSDLGNLIYDVS
jgi:hypothetical protein